MGGILRNLKFLALHTLGWFPSVLLSCSRDISAPDYFDIIQLLSFLLHLHCPLRLQKNLMFMPYDMIANMINSMRSASFGGCGTIRTVE